jgi:hypothetical protein
METVHNPQYIARFEGFFVPADQVPNLFVGSAIRNINDQTGLL